MISRSEGAGLTVAVLGHVALIGLLAIGYAASPAPLKPHSDPIEVSITDEVGLESQAPELSTETPAERKGEVEAEPEPESAPEATAEPEPAAKPQPPAPKPQPAPDAAKPTKPAKPPAQPTTSTKPVRREVKPSGNISDPSKPDGPATQPTNGTSTKPPATSIGPEVKASLSAELTRRLRPFWNPPTGADADKLKTVIRVALNPDGSIGTIGDCRQTGVTASNRAQADLHCEAAKKAIRLAAPFRTFPEQYYQAWKVIFPAFDWRLAQ